MLELALMRENWVKPDTLLCLTTASVPVIKLIAKLGDLPVDISIEDIQLYHGYVSWMLSKQWRLNGLALISVD